MARDATGGAPPPGIYDALLTRELEAALARLPPELWVTAEVDPHHAPRAIGRLLGAQIVAVLAGLRGDVARQVDLANRVVELLRSVDASAVTSADEIAEPARELQAILAPAVAPAIPAAPVRPSIPLSSSDLLVNGPSRPRVPGKGHVLLFVRARNKDARGETMPYTLLGEVYCATHRGARPMQIEWELAVPMPAGLYSEVKVAAG